MCADPARIDRTDVISVGSIGAGQSTEVQVVTPGLPVSLSCLTDGVNTPTTGWFYVSVDGAGCAVEVAADSISGVSM